MFANKLREKVPDPCNAKQHYDSFLKKKNRKSIKQSDIITYQPKTFQNPNMVDIKQATVEQPEVVGKPSEGEKANSNRSFYSDTRNRELQLKDTESATKSKLIELLIQLRGLKFVTTLLLVFKKLESKDKTKYDNFYSNSKSETTNKGDIDNMFQSIYTAIIENIQKSSLKD